MTGLSAFDRAPSHKRPSWPAMVDVAERLRGGEPLEAIAAELERDPGTIRLRLNQAGFASDGSPNSMPRDGFHQGIRALWNYPDWYDRARCAETDPEAFFPEQGESTRLAKAVCERCPVQAECADYAIANQERFGVWGGLSERERRKIAGHQQELS